MKLDIVIPLKTSLISLAIKQTIPSILLKLSYNNVYVITKNSNFSTIEFSFGDRIKCLDEDKICDGLTMDNISKYFQLKNVKENRSGWYFQQFLKLGVSELCFISDLYLIWDADAIVLRPIDFFSKDGRVFFDKTKEFHKPYFEVMEKLIRIKKQVDYSFISEHIVFSKKIVLSILNKISGDKKKDWWTTILDNINSNDLPKSGFSEYELYGNYIAKYHPNHFKVRNLYKSRNGTAYLGMNPSSFSLKLFSYVFDYMSFEEWIKKYRPLLYRFLMIIIILCVTMAKKSLKRFLRLTVK